MLRIREALNEDEEVLAIVLVELGGAAQADSRLPLAAASFDRARRIREKQWGPTHVLSGECAKLGARPRAARRPREGVHALRAGLPRLRQDQGPPQGRSQSLARLPARVAPRRALVSENRGRAARLVQDALGDGDAAGRDAQLRAADARRGRRRAAARRELVVVGRPMDCAVNASWERPAALAARSHSPILVT